MIKSERKKIIKIINLKSIKSFKKFLSIVNSNLIICITKKISILKKIKNPLIKFILKAHP